MWHFARPHSYLVAVINQYIGGEMNNFMVQTSLQHNLSPQTQHTILIDIVVVHFFLHLILFK